MPRIACENPNCPGPPDVVATYSHAHPTGPRTWTAPAEGPTPDGAPHPQPCPDESVSCAAISVNCRTCGWAKQYPAQPVT